MNIAFVHHANDEVLVGTLLWWSKALLIDFSDEIPFNHFIVILQNKSSQLGNWLHRES